MTEPKPKKKWEKKAASKKDDTDSVDYWNELRKKLKMRPLADN